MTTNAPEPAGEGSDVFGHEQGGTDEFGQESGGTDEFGQESGGADEFGQGSGGADEVGEERARRAAAPLCSAPRRPDGRGKRRGAGAAGRLLSDQRVRQRADAGQPGRQLG